MNSDIIQSLEKQQEDKYSATNDAASSHHVYKLSAVVHSWY